MSVYTWLDQDQAQTLVAPLGLPPVVRLQAITEGIENSTYRLELADGSRWYLSVLERTPVGAMAFLIGLLVRLADAGLPVAAPPTRCTENLPLLDGKPVLLLRGLAGTSPDPMTPPQASALGAAVARAHLSAATLDADRPDATPVAALGHEARTLGLPESDLDLVERLAGAANEWLASDSWPSGPIHGDLFFDNLLFEGDRLTGILDWAQAHRGLWLYDLAVLVNACKHTATATEVLHGYARVRPFRAAEVRHWDQVRALAAAVLWVARLGRLAEARDPAQRQRLSREKPAAPYANLCRALAVGADGVVLPLRL